MLRGDVLTGGVPPNKAMLWCDSSISATSTDLKTADFGFEPGDELYCYASGTGISISVFGK